MVVWIRCTPLDRRVPARAGDLVYDRLRASDIPLASSCDGSAICGRCRIQIEGPVDPPEAAELEVLDKQGHAQGRLACCTRVRGDVTVTTTYW